MKKKLKPILILLVFLAGLSLLLYPLVANEWNNHIQRILTKNYSSAIAQLEDEGKIDYEAEWEKAREYNRKLLPTVLPDSFSIAANAEEKDEEYMSCVNLTGDGMMGRVVIPKINVDIPIYHTTEKEVLEKAAGHLQGSSLPVGGENTHSVISAHRGLPTASLFTDLDKLEEGDHFLIYVLDDILCYEVEEILVVEPDQTESLVVQKGQDLVTLLTCTPYGINSQRLLVRGHRIPYELEVLKAEEGTAGFSTHTNYLFWVVVGLGITTVAILGMAGYMRWKYGPVSSGKTSDRKRRNDRRNRRKTKEEEKRS